MKHTRVLIGLVVTAVMVFSGVPNIRGQRDELISITRGALRYSQFMMLQNAGLAINAPDMDQSPAPAPNGLSLYFTSSRAAGGQGGSDIWVSQRATLTSAWGAAQNLGTGLNTASNDTVTNISPSGLEMFLTSNRGGNPDLYVSSRTDANDDFGWTVPVSLGSLNSTLQDVGGVYFEDPRGGATLFFWSDRAEVGLGDIYQSSRNSDRSFNAPELVTALNSPAAERGFAISSDGKEVFISSTRLGTPTVFAIFTSTRGSTSAPWSEPVPVYTLNGAGSNSQPTLSADNTILYLTSNRTGGFGNGDIYSAARVPLQKECP
jgi:hypothetical protein